MAQDASQRWNRTDGVLIAPGTTPEAVADAFAERGVVVRLEWFPATTHLLSLTLMTDVEGRVAVTPPSRGGVVPGPSVSELVESLARQFTADVAVGPAAFNALPDDVELPSISHHGSASARTVVISPDERLHGAAAGHSAGAAPGGGLDAEPGPPHRHVLR